MEVTDICMQAACGENELSQDGQYGGVFTLKYLNTCIHEDCMKSLSIFGMIGYSIPMAAGALLAVGSYIVKDLVAKGLYNAATATFSPVCYQPDDSGEAGRYIGSRIDDKGYEYSIYLRTNSGWMGMDLHESGGTLGNVTTFGVIKNV